MVILRYILLVSIVVIGTILSGCEGEIDTTKEREKLLQTDREFSAYSVSHGAAEAFNTYLIENALQLSAGKNPLQGRDQIYKAMLKAGNNYILSWEPQDGEVSSSGDLGYTWGLYTMSYQDANGETKQSKGKYLNVWRKDLSGNWRVLVDMGNKNPEE